MEIIKAPIASLASGIAGILIGTLIVRPADCAQQSALCFQTRTASGHKPSCFQDPNTRSPELHTLLLVAEAS